MESRELYNSLANFAVDCPVWVRVVVTLNPGTAAEEQDEQFLEIHEMYLQEFDAINPSGVEDPDEPILRLVLNTAREGESS